jgi:colanic acid/amylovoran biosynthesis glycosyltransferase
VEEPVEIVSVGRFVEKKGFDDLLRALAKAREMTGRSFRCSIIGSGPLEDELRALATSLELDGRVHFMGYMKNEDLDAYLARMHIMVQPSKTARDGDME